MDGEKVGDPAEPEGCRNVNEVTFGRNPEGAVDGLLRSSRKSRESAPPESACCPLIENFSGRIQTAAHRHLARPFEEVRNDTARNNPGPVPRGIARFSSSPGRAVKRGRLRGDIFIRIFLPISSNSIRGDLWGNRFPVGPGPAAGCGAGGGE
jgi:hypothetical protein